MRILIFGEAFLPPAYLPRVRYFCSYFAKKGWDIDMVVENSDIQNHIPKEASVLLIDYYKNKHRIGSKIEWLIKFSINLFWDYKGYYFYKKSQQFLTDKQYDLVFCSSCFTFPLPTAAKVAKKFDIPLFVDLRDIAEQSPDDNHYLANKPPKILGDLITGIFKTINIKRRNRVLKFATGVTTISPWHVQTLKQYNPNTHLIYNGFDETKFFPEEKKTDKFTISYFGRVYNEQIRNPRLLFEAIQQLHKKKTFTPETIIVKWFVDEPSKKVIQGIAKEYDLEKFIEYHNFVQPDDLIIEMNKSSVLLILCNIITNKNYFGIMTTKFFEAVGVNKPVLCIPDNQDNLSKLIKELNCGLASSEAIEVEDFLLTSFLKWEKTKCTKGSLTETVRLSLSRRTGAEILEKIFLENIKTRS
jgi:glycosyltransferase involved in cell wall biosynthesis